MVSNTEFGTQYSYVEMRFFQGIVLRQVFKNEKDYLRNAVGFSFGRCICF